MKINLTQLKINGVDFSTRQAFQEELFWNRAIEPKTFRADNVGYDLHKKACIKKGLTVN